MKRNLKARWLALAMTASSLGCASGTGGATPGLFASWTNPFALQASAQRPNPRKEADDELSLENTVKPKADFYLAAGALAESRGDNDAAIAQYQQAIAKDSKNIKAHLHLARLYDRVQQYPEAETAYAAAITAAPTNPTPLNDYAMCLARQRRYDEAIDHFQKAIMLQKHHALYRNNIAEVLVKAGRPREAFDHLSAVHSVAESHYNLGMLLRRNGELEPARQQIVAALQVDPGMTAAEDVLAELGRAPQTAQRPRSKPPTREVAAPSNLRAQAPKKQLEAETQESPIEQSKAPQQAPGGYYEGVEEGDQGRSAPAEVLARKPKNGRKSTTELRAKINDASAKLR
jgi:tetratricopeptide (TPR) repeat protein